MVAVNASVAVAVTLVSDIRCAFADNAFPDAQAVLLPRDRPNQIMLATTFGLVFSDDDGATWSYACENPATTQTGREYSVGPPPEDRIFAVSDLGAPVSPDTGCTWHVAEGALVGTVVTDVFPDPARADRAFAIALPIGQPSISVFRSLDGGMTYAATTLVGPTGTTITGVESAASAQGIVYATIDQRVDGLAPMLARSDDGGDTWSTRSLLAALGPVTPRLISVDPGDPQRVLLRLISGATAAGGPGEALGMTTDSGVSWTTPLVLAGGTILGFARLSDGTLLVAGTSGTAGANLYHSEDGGVTFGVTPVAFNPRGLAARGTVLFAATNDAIDGFALASSDDAGRTWRPRLRFSEISGVRACVKAACQADCNKQADLKLFSRAVCQTAGCGCEVGDRTARLGSMGSLILAGGLLALAFGRGRRRASRSRAIRRVSRDGGTLTARPARGGDARTNSGLRSAGRDGIP